MGITASSSLGAPLQAGKEEERQMFQQMQAMAQKQVNKANALVIRFSVPMSLTTDNDDNIHINCKNSISEDITCHVN